MQIGTKVVDDGGSIEQTNVELLKNIWALNLNNTDR